MDHLESEFLRHEPCPDCGSSDALSVYSDGHTFCFSCQTHTRSNNDDSSMYVSGTSDGFRIQGYPQRLNKRRISDSTCKRFQITVDRGELRFHYFDRNGKVIGAKVKTKDKQFRYEGDTDGRFFGQHLWTTFNKRLVITEGELDAASCSETQPGWPVVSLPTGAAGAKRAVQQNLEWLQSWDEIVLFFDNDEAGRKATEEAASLLPPGKVKIAAFHPEYKDASDALVDGNNYAINDAINHAKPYTPGEIVNAKDLYELIISNPDNCLHEYPFNGLQTKTHGIRLGELTTITAGTGIGKSSFCSQLATDLLNKGERVGYLALEESNRRTALRLMSVDQGKSFHLGNHERTTLSEAFDNTIARWNLFLYDGFGSIDPDVIYNRVEFLAKGLDCRVIFVDHLSILISGLDGDERRMIDKTMTRLRSLVESTQVSLFLVSHLRRTQSDQNHEEGARTNLGQLRGSAAIAQLSDCVIGLERNQQDEGDANSTVVRVLKNRYSGETGTAGTLSYDIDTCRFNEIETKEDPNSYFTETPEF